MTEIIETNGLGYTYREFEFQVQEILAGTHGIRSSVVSQEEAARIIKDKWSKDQCASQAVFPVISASIKE